MDPRPISRAALLAALSMAACTGEAPVMLQGVPLATATPDEPMAEGDAGTLERPPSSQERR